MTRYRVVYWKHIPSAISLQGDDGREIKVQLPERFQKAIDAYAMAAWRRGDWMEREGTPEQVAAALLSELETAFAKIEIPRRKA